MAGPFDDLIPAQAQANPFADLIPKKKQDTGITGDNLARAFSQGATFGLGDELAAGVRAAAPGVSNWMMRGPALQRDESIGGSPEPQTVSTAPTYDQRYAEELQKERDRLKQFAAENPKTAMAANVAGGLATTALALPEAAVSIGPSALANVAKATGIGGVLGAAQGFGEGEGTQDRLARAGIGGTVGASLGLAARPLAALGRSISESAPGRVVGDGVGAIARVLGGAETAPAGAATNGALTRIADALQRSRMGAGEVDAKLAQLGNEAIPADVSPQLLQLAVNAKTLPGDTRQIAEDVLKPRIGRTGERMIGAAEGTEPPPSHFQLRGEGQAFDTHARDVGQTAYGAMEAAGFKNSPGISKMIAENPQVEGAVDRVLASEKASRLGTDRQPASVVDLMHKVKREVQNVGLDSSGRPSSTAYYWDQTANDFVKALKAANPELAAADRAFAQAKSLPEFYDTGAGVLSKGLDEKATQSSAGGLAEALTGATENQALAARAGTTNAVRSVAQTLTGARGLARDIEFSSQLKDKLGQIYGPEQAQRLIQQAQAEGVFANTGNRLIGGPHTADDLVGASNLGNIAVRATPGGITPRWTETLKAALNWVSSPNEAVRNEIGRTLINPSAKANEKTIEALAKLLQARARGGVGAAAASGALGGQAGSL